MLGVVWAAQSRLVLSPVRAPCGLETGAALTSPKKWSIFFNFPIQITFNITISIFFNQI